MRRLLLLRVCVVFVLLVVLCCVVQCWWLVASSSVSVRGIFSYYFRTWEIWEKTLGLKEWDNKINTR